jgi:hypothetical protein
MKYLCLAYYNVRKFEALSEQGLNALEKQCAPHDRALRASGRLLAQASLGPPSASRSLRPGNGAPSVIDGPFAETKEQVGGFFIIEAGGIDEAVEVAARHPAAQLGEHIGWGVEVRPIDHYEG